MQTKNAPLQRNKFLLPVILSGGVGSRLWPLSREAHPKPFIKLDDGESLLQKTYLRAARLEEVHEILTVTNRELFFYSKDLYQEVAKQGIQHSFILEPFGRNSSAAVALAAHYARQTYGDDCILLIMPADHLIQDQEAFEEAVNNAVNAAQTGKLTTFGIKPDSPQTGYGYIEADGENVKQFVEKPDENTARKYVEAGNYYWNSGMFCMSASSILNEMNEHCPDISEDISKCLHAAKTTNGHDWKQIEVLPNTFEPVRNISIDYSVFEKSQNVAVIPCDIGWSDIGSWEEFGALHPEDKDGNRVHGDTILEGVSGCIVHGGDRLVAGLGLNDIVIADTPDALLVAHKGHAQEVKEIVSRLKANDNPSYQLFPTVHRPWGSYTVLLEGDGFKLKKIEVKPGAALSLQSHKHRSEHWVVVSGVARVTNGDDILQLMPNQSTYIPVGNKHRLENPGNELLTLIEVQCGDYLGEDDIIRYEDKFGRV